MDLSKSIKTAWEAVKDSGVPEHLQESAFREALRTILGGPQLGRQQKVDQAFVGGDSATDEPGDGMGEAAKEVSEDAVIAAVAEYTQIPSEKLEKVFHIDSGQVKLLVNHNALGKTSADKTRAAAQIITIVRKIGMDQADTPFDVIRDECQKKHFYDAKNFANKHLANIDGFAVKGETRNKRLEARASGISAFSDLVDKVLGKS